MEKQRLTQLTRIISTGHMIDFWEPFLPSISLGTE
jgi:hypothetical protein